MNTFSFSEYTHDLLDLFRNGKPEGQNTCLCTLVSGKDWIDIVNYTYPRNRAWVKIKCGISSVSLKHEHIIYPSSKIIRPPSWHKLYIMAAVLSLGYNVIWIDADAVLTQDFPDPFLKLKKGQFATALDQNGANCGFIALPFGQESMELLARWWGRTEEINHPWWEQKALHNMMREDKELASRWRGVPNSEGIIHAAGVPVSGKLAWLKERVGF